jgi:hypothetical protein
MASKNNDESLPNSSWFWRYARFLVWSRTTLNLVLFCPRSYLSILLRHKRYI